MIRKTLTAVVLTGSALLWGSGAYATPVVFGPSASGKVTFTGTGVKPGGPPPPDAINVFSAFGFAGPATFDGSINGTLPGGSHQLYDTAVQRNQLSDHPRRHRGLEV